MAERWDRARVLALAPDASSQRAAQSLTSGRAWAASGASPGTGTRDDTRTGPAALWGECRGSASAPYLTVIDLSGPAYRCSCPSRKFPCKHALALLLLWADGTVPEAAGEPPGWAASWLTARAVRAGAATAGRAAAGERDAPGAPKDQKTAARRAEQREARVASGLTELDRWLCDQVRQGLAASQQAGYRHWDDIAARMIDAQASGLAERLRGLASVPHSGPGWDGRLLEEYSLLRLLAVAYRGQAGLPGPLRETVRSRIGFSLRQADVLAGGEPVRDHWQVLGRRDVEQDRVRARRTWLRGRKTGRPALVLSFAPAGAGLDDSLTPGTDIDAALVSYPGAVPLRAIVQARHGTAGGSPPDGDSVTGFLAGYAAALAEDPWLDTWPAVLEVTPARSPGPAVSDAAGDAVPLHPEAGICWTLLALSGGHPVTLAGEWTPRGLWPLTAWDEDGQAVPL
ncbi:MAG TPA: SWIM zinc finger family protein [Streptosporangiaceae bacterium]|nr:SWIM zinc finger family protein [Streptosporangiaceae bacterium]